MTVKPWIIKAIALTALTLAAAFFIGIYIFWVGHYQDRIYPGRRIGDLDLGGKTVAEATAALAERIKTIESTGLNFQYGDKTATIGAAVASFDSDLAYSTLSFDAAGSVATVYGHGWERSFFSYLLNFLTPADQKESPAVYALNEEAIRSFLAENFPELNVAPENAYFSVVRRYDQTPQLQRNPERPGKEINYDQVIEEIKNNLDQLQNHPLRLRTRSKYPTVKQADLNHWETEVRAIVDRGELLLKSPTLNDDTLTGPWRVSPDRLITWASVRPDGGQTTLSFDQEKIQAYLREQVAPAIDQEAVLPRFEIKGDRVSSWQQGADGRAVDLAATAAAITDGLLSGRHEVDLIIKTTTNEALKLDSQLNIKEIVGSGHSVFTGSPANRRHNIAVGAAALHGLLIKPGEEFSLVEALGDISDKTGYLPELVIKGNKTVPEFGGGLCQIGTTVFRTALASGLPITERRNHSYRVSYYEPAGTDATIYSPRPDLRFINDTGNYLLIQARLLKNDLYFDFWGVKDGRAVTTTAPVIYNIVKPEPTKIIETDDLAPGQKKCTESSHNGADAYFDYIVTYPAGATTTPIQERRFKSHYIPWQAVCLVGKTASSSASSTSEQATSSPDGLGAGDQKTAGEPAASSTSSN
ncbi:MAG: VanW family protein [Patescibacteria group bacterium]